MEPREVEEDPERVADDFDRHAAVPGQEGHAWNVDDRLRGGGVGGARGELDEVHFYVGEELVGVEEAVEFVELLLVRALWTVNVRGR